MARAFLACKNRPAVAGGWRRCGAALVLFFAGWIEAATVGEQRLPPVSGELKGVFMAPTSIDAPRINWRLTFRSGTPVQRDADVWLEGPGMLVRAEARLDPAGDGTWRILEGQVDLARWFAALVSTLGSNPGEMLVTGALAVEGAGTWRDGKADGKARVRLTDGRIDDAVHKLLLEGVALDVEILDIAAPRTATSQRLTWTGGRYDVITLGPGRVVFAIDGGRVQVEEALVGAFAGELALSPFEFSLADPVFSTTARVNGAEAAMFLPLLPPVVSEARGRLDGTVLLTRSATGVQIGEGRLALRRGEAAELRLMPTPGLLSNTLPETMKKYYPGLSDLEAGKIPLRAELLEVSFTPAGDAEGRTASVHVAGGPVDPRLRAPVDLTVNVRGPLEWLIKFGTDSRLHWGR